MAACVQPVSVAMSNQLRRDVLRAYKTILRLSQSWTAKNETETQAERNYIMSEAKRTFRANAHLSSEVAIKNKLDEAYVRVEVAKHYQIPFPRPIYYATGSYTKGNKKRIKKTFE